MDLLQEDIRCQFDSAMTAVYMTLVSLLSSSMPLATFFADCVGVFLLVLKRCDLSVRC